MAGEPSRRDTQRAVGHREPVAGLLACACWCGAHIVLVPADLIGTTTDTCGQPGCTPKEQR